MTWLLKLYPPRWRQRYGREFHDLIAPQRFSVVTVLDIIGGAIDAWTRPQSHLAAQTAAHPEGDTTMLARMMRLRCAGHGETPTIVDSLKGAGVIIGGTLVCVFIANWMSRHGFNSVYPDTLLSSGWLLAFVLAMPYTTLKGWPRVTQAIFIGMVLAVLTLLTFGAAWING